MYSRGNSKFYVNPDSSMYQTKPFQPSSSRNADPSLYLVNSTFYRDKVPDTVAPASKLPPAPVYRAPRELAGSEDNSLLLAGNGPVGSHTRILPTTVNDSKRELPALTSSTASASSTNDIIPKPPVRKKSVFNENYSLSR